MIHLEYSNAGMELEKIHKRKACDSNRCIKTMSIVNGEGQEGTQSSYGFMSFLEVYEKKKKPKNCIN